MSTLKVNTIQNTSGGSSSTPEQIEQGRAKAWIHFDGQDTVAIRDSFNVSTLTDNGTGDYTISFTTAMANTNYAVATTQPGQHDFTQAILCIEETHSNAFATGSLKVKCVKTGANTAADRNTNCVVIHGD